MWHWKFLDCIIFFWALAASLLISFKFLSDSIVIASPQESRPTLGETAPSQTGTETSSGVYYGGSQPDVPAQGSSHQPGLTNRRLAATSIEQESGLPLFLLTCMSRGTYAVNLLQLDLRHTLSDSQLFRALKAQYTGLRHRWQRIWSFKTAASIQFVQFESHRKALVDIRKRDDIPPESRKDEYKYDPLPADLIPPVGKNFLMHIYQHPEDADRDAICLARFPKRKNERLHIRSGNVTELGWGLHFEEGLHWKKIWAVGVAVTIASVIFGICWSILKHDIQGGFGVSGYTMAILAFGIGTMQAIHG
jgi:hypothetical protein